jgi:hypothetical protein
MVLSALVWHELIDLGVLDGSETCALCRERPLILLDAARAPVLLCPAHARALAGQLDADLKQLFANETTPQGRDASSVTANG